MIISVVGKERVKESTTSLGIDNLIRVFINTILGGVLVGSDDCRNYDDH